jgi:peptidoglycan/LPS O-acetylase OafA/YrhL
MARRDIGPDLLRGIAILLVMATHMPYDHVPEAFETCLGSYGWFGVDIFFVLSGYLIGGELLRPVQAGGAPDLVIFYLKRVFRILPVFWLILAIYALWPGLREGATMAPVWRFLTFTVNLNLDIRTARSFSHAWSLCVEEHFYLLLPLIILGLHRLRTHWLPVVLALALVVSGMVLRDHLWRVAQGVGGGPAEFLKFVYYPTWCRLDGLICGVGLAALRLFRPALWTRFARPALLAPVSILCMALAVGMTVSSGEILGEIASVIVYPLFSFGVALLLAALVRLEPNHKSFRATGLGFIAMISYSLYLCQKLVYQADNRWLPPQWTQGWVAVGVYYLSAIIVATFLYILVERTFMRLRARVLAHMKKPPQSPETAFS